MTNSESRVLKALKRRPKTGLTKKEIRVLSGVENVGDVIMKLRKKHKIDTNMQKEFNRYGEPVRFARYRLIG